MRQIVGYNDSSTREKYNMVIEKTTSEAMPPNNELQQIKLKPKRIRSAFTTEQINCLEKQYNKFPYITGEQRKEVAKFLKIGEKSVKIWFQNRRMREKKENHKEFDLETIRNEKFDKDQLNNVPAPPSTNDQQSGSLPILASTSDIMAVANTDKTKTNKFEHNKEYITKAENIISKSVNQSSIANFYREACNEKYLSQYSHIPDKTNSQFETDLKTKRPLSASQEYKSNASAEFSINLCKKYKQECTNATDTAGYGNIPDDDKQKQKKPDTNQSQTNGKKFYNSHSKDFTTGKNKKVTYQSPKQVELNPAYYPILPNVYAPPFVQSGGVIWKPVNFMPVVATNVPPITLPCHQESPAHEQGKDCKCNCHGSTHHRPLNLPSSLQNPYDKYGHYLITVPFSQTSPKYKF